MALAIRGIIAAGLMGGFGVVLVIAGCTKPNRNSQINRADGAPDQGRTCIDASCSNDTGLADIGPEVIAPSDAASDNCRVVDPEEGLDDAGIEEESQGTAVVEGLITIEGDCLSGVEVCVTRSFDTWSICSLVTTDRYGRFIYRDDSEYSDAHHIYFRPRKGGFTFEPEYHDRYFDPDGDETNLEPLRFTAIRRGYLSHATGRWRVIEDKDISVCTPTMPTTSMCQSNPDQTGNTFEFTDGCLFEGMNCVSDLEYKDVSDFCRSFDLWNAGHGLNFSPVIYEGEFDPDTQRWIITKSLGVSWAVMGIKSVSESTMVLERDNL